MNKKYKTEVREDGRICTFCQIFKTWENFYFHKTRHCYNSECDECRLTKRREKAKLPEERQKRRNYLIINKEKVKEAYRRRSKNPKAKQKQRERNRKNYLKNKEKICEQAKKYRDERYVLGVLVFLRDDPKKIGKIIGENVLRKGVLVKWQGVPTPTRILQKFIKNLPEKNYLEI